MRTLLLSCVIHSCLLFHLVGGAEVQELMTQEGESRQLLRAVDKASNEWLKIPGVVGVSDGERDGRQVLVVLTSIDASEIAARIPKTFMGFPVVIEESGEISSQ